MTVSVNHRDCRLVALAALMLSAHALAAVEAWADDALPWQARADAIRVELANSTQRLAAAQEAVLGQARDRAPHLVARLVLDPPTVRPSGYGTLPEIRPDKAAGVRGPRETRYSLAGLDRRSARAHANTTGLLADTDAEPVNLEALTTRFEALRGQLRNMESHLSYHDYWQQALADRPAFFRERNHVIVMLRQRQTLSSIYPQKHAQATTSLDEQIRDRVNRFRPTAGLRIREGANGERVLPIVLLTDIDDSRFRDAFAQAVDTIWNSSDAARMACLRIAVSISYISPHSLYAGEPPTPGSGVDLKAHLARFPHDALVLTTGARSTHAWTGRGIVLGSAPLSRRALAHEFGHLLGFEDAYVRGYDGDPSGPWGAVILEWTGVVDDLMGIPGHGEVTAEMVERLIEAYEEPLATEDTVN